MIEYSYPSLWRDCVGAWCPSEDRFRDTRLHDLSGRNNHGTLTNMDPATDWVLSGSKMSLDFDGVDDRVALPIVMPYVGQKIVTICMWINFRSFVYDARYFQQWGAPSSDQAFIFSTSYLNGANSLQIATSTGTGSYSIGHSNGGILTTDTWTHIAGAVNQNTAQHSLYLNGIPIVCTMSHVSSNAIIQSSLPAAIGGEGTLCVNGLIDDIRLYNRALSTTEMSSLARRRGIAYETERRQRYKTATVGNNRKRSSRFLAFPA